jgi:hypothetical protein
MPANFKLKQRTSKNTCDAMRCKEPPPYAVSEDGVKLCETHVAKLTELERAAFEMRLRDSTADKEETESQEESIRAQIEPVRAEAIYLIDSLEGIEIVDSDTNELVGELLKETHGKLKEIDAKRKEATAPLMQAKKAIDSWFKPAKDALEAAKKLLKDKTQNYYNELERQRQEALESGDLEEVLSTPEPATSTATATRRVWTFEVTSLESVPRKFMCVDEGKIKDTIANGDPTTLNIPGVRIFQETKIVMGR